MSGSCFETPSRPIVPHNNRRLEKFLQAKNTENIHPNGLLSRLFVGCCAPKDDAIFKFLTSSCRLSDLTAMALVPVIKALKNILLSKVAIGIALAILAYYLAKYVHLPALIFTPIIAIILGYLVADIGQSAIDAVVSLYEAMQKAYEKAQENLTHATDVEVTQNSFKYIDEEIVETILLCNFADENWRSRALVYCMQHNVHQPRRPFTLKVPAHVYRLLKQIDDTKLDPKFLQDLIAQVRPNTITGVCVKITDQIKQLFNCVGLISDTFCLPSAVFFYTSTKKFLKQMYEIFQDLYPPIYEYLTGRKYIAPEVAKYLAIFGDICKQVQVTLKTARQSNIVKEDAKFRLDVILQYEQLQESQMKLLEVKAPPIYMTPVNNLLREMSTLANECYSRSKGEAARDEPVLIFLRGPPGTGKTTVDHALALIIAERLGIKIDLRTDFFSRDAGVEHFDGYENQMFVVLDDAFLLTDPVKQATTILEVIKMKNTAPYKLTMAALEAKKNSFFNSKFVFISTNVENVVCDQVADIGAFYRRIDFDVTVRKRPPVNADGSINFDYDMSVNGKPCNIPVLADSIVAVHKQRALADKNVAQAIARYAKSVQPCAVEDLIPARDSVTDFNGLDQSKYKDTSAARPRPKVISESTDQRACAAATLPRANGLVQVIKRCVKQIPVPRYVVHCFNTIDCNKAWQTSFVSEVKTIEYLKIAQKYATWLATFALSYGAMLMLCKLVKNLTTSIVPNSKKTKDQLTGDKTTVVSTNKQTIKDQLKAAQAKVDSKAVKQTLKANSSSTRWTQAMIHYIEEMGWQSQQWVADSLANIKFSDEFESTEQENNDLQALKHNIVEIFTYYTVNGDQYKMHGKAIALNQNTLMTVSHQIPNNTEINNLEIEMCGKVINIRSCTIDRIKDSDTAMITLHTVIPAKDISYMLMPLSENTTKDAEIYLLRNFEDVLTLCPVEDFKPHDRVISYKTDYNEIINCGSVFQCKVAVCPGDSGSIYIVRDAGRLKITGVHISSGFSYAYGRFIFREMLKDYIKPPRNAATPFASVVKVIDQNSRSFDERLACNSNCIPIGVVDPRTMISNRSKIQRSVLYRHSKLPPLTEFPAHLKRTYDEDDILLKANAKFRLRSEPTIEPELEEEIVRALLDEHPNTPTKTFYTNVEAVEGNVDMPKITMTTSSGYPYSAIGKTPKTKLTEQDWIEICADTDDMLQDLYNGHMPQAIFQTSFKDEIRPFEKVKNPRVINCAKTSLTLLFRRVLGPWMNMIHKNHHKLATKVGINAHGVDWKVFYDRLISISADNLVELDYSGYEYNHPQFGYKLASLFIYLLYKRSGFTERDAQAAKLLILSCAGGFVIQNDILIFIWMLLSGLPITAELNSLLNEIYQMVAYKKLTFKPLITMKQLVESGYYGDDLLHAVHDKIKDLFNAITIRDFCRDFLSMKVTPASNKAGEMTPFIGILECSFLCRKFAPRENRVDAPLKLEASTNSLQYYVPVAHMTQKELLSSKCRSFITELTHYPQEIYNHWIEILRDVKAEYSLDFIGYDYSAALARRVSMTDDF
jgi:hypothetical protein